jgi:hypothetical protein
MTPEALEAPVFAARSKASREGLPLTAPAGSPGWARSIFATNHFIRDQKWSPGCWTPQAVLATSATIPRPSRGSG